VPGGLESVIIWIRGRHDVSSSIETEQVYRTQDMYFVLESHSMVLTFS
jgi:hypothetical protein